MVIAMDMDTAMNIIQKMMMIDIHSHLLFGVDDGSKSLSMSLEMLDIYDNQGIKSIILTPHVNSSVSYKSRKEHQKNFSILKKYADQKKIDIYLGAEVYIPFKLPEIDFDSYTMGDSKILLVEFSTYNESPIVELVYNLQIRGYRIIIAHIERYSYLKDYEYEELKNMGIMFQVNSSSFFKKRLDNYSRTKKLLKKGYIDFVASDCHGILRRPINLKEAYEKVKKLSNLEYANKIFFQNQKKFFSI
jgi:protein-tyrosine phosphatase